MDKLQKKDKDMDREISTLNRSIDEKVGEYRMKWIQEQNESQRLKVSNKEVKEHNLILETKVSELNTSKEHLLKRLFELERHRNSQDGDKETLQHDKMVLESKVSELSSAKEDLMKRIYSLEGERVDSRSNSLKLQEKITTISSEKGKSFGLIFGSY